MPIYKECNPLCVVLRITHLTCCHTQGKGTGGTIIRNSKGEKKGKRYFSTPLPAHYQQQWDQVIRAYAGKNFYNAFFRTIQRLTKRQKTRCWCLSSFLNWRQVMLITQKKGVYKDTWMKVILWQKCRILMLDPRQVSNVCQAAHAAPVPGELEKPGQSKEITSFPVVAEN